MGLTDLLQAPQASDVQRAAVSTAHPNVWLLGAGSTATNPSELLGSARMEEVLAALRATYDLVLLDTPPALGPTDATVVAELADAVVLVVRAGHTRGRALRDAIDVVSQSRTPLVGAVLNEVPRGRPGYATTLHAGAGVDGDA